MGMLSPDFLHYLAIGAAIAISSIGSGIGQGWGAFGAIQALSRQPTGSDKVFRAMVIGLAFIESGVILALVITLMMLFATGLTITWGIGWAELGIAIMIGVAATSISIASCYAVKSTCISISRQPFFFQRLITLMLVCQSMMEAPVVFSFIIALILKSNFSVSLTIFTGIKYVAASLCMMFGAIGPSIGLGVFTNSACYASSLNTNAYTKLFSFSIINGAVIQTPLIFTLLMSILIIFWPETSGSLLGITIAFVVSAFAMGLAACGTSSAAGFVASKTSKQIALNPKSYSVLFRSNILAIAFIESCAIYALIVSLVIITRSY